MWELSCCISPTELITEAVNVCVASPPYTEGHLHINLWTLGFKGLLQGPVLAAMVQLGSPAPGRTQGWGLLPRRDWGSPLHLSDPCSHSWKVTQTPSYLQNSTFTKKSPPCLSRKAGSSRGMQSPCCCQRPVGIIISLIFVVIPRSCEH